MNVLIGLLILASFGLAVWAYPQLPEVIAVHWNAAGQVDGYGGKFWGVFLLPTLLLGLWALFAILPQIDPLKANIAKFRPAYNLTVLMILLVLAVVAKLALLWNLGYRFPFTLIMLGLLNVLSIGLGGVLPQMKRNFFMGIRTPWTLASDAVWDQTHRVGGRLFVAAGVVGLLSLVAGTPVAVWVTLLTHLSAAVSVIGYSYIVYRRMGSAKAA